MDIPVSHCILCEDKGHQNLNLTGSSIQCLGKEALGVNSLHLMLTEECIEINTSFMGGTQATVAVPTRALELWLFFRVVCNMVKMAGLLHTPVLIGH